LRARAERFIPLEGARNETAQGVFFEAVVFAGCDLFAFSKDKPHLGCEWEQSAIPNDFCPA
jgi:hypothetical protein